MSVSGFNCHAAISFAHVPRSKLRNWSDQTGQISQLLWHKTEFPISFPFPGKHNGWHRERFNNVMGQGQNGTKHGKEPQSSSHHHATISNFFWNTPKNKKTMLVQLKMVWAFYMYPESPIHTSSDLSWSITWMQRVGNFLLSHPIEWRSALPFILLLSTFMTLTAQ